jgi:hypothetical protein
LNFYLFAVMKSKAHGPTTLWASPDKKAEFKKKYFDPMVNTIEAGFSSCDEQSLAAEKQQEPLCGQMKNQVGVKRANLEVLRMLLLGQVSEA